MYSVMWVGVLTIWSRKASLTTERSWVTFCSNRNTLTLDSNSYKKTNLSGVNTIVIVRPLPLVDAHTIICPKY